MYCMYVCTRLRVYACIYVSKDVCLYVSRHAFMHLCMHICMFVCMYLATCKRLLRIPTMVLYIVVGLLLLHCSVLALHCAHCICLCIASPVLHLFFASVFASLSLPTNPRVFPLHLPIFHMCLNCIPTGHGRPLCPRQFECR